jgi:hypothetical protein
MSSPQPEPRPGDEEFARAAICGLAAVGRIRHFPPREVQEKPTPLICMLLANVFESLKSAYPEDERVQLARLKPHHTPEQWEVDCDLFGEHLVTIPHYAPIADEELPHLEELVYSILQVRVYSCAKLMTLAVDPAAAESELPTLADFLALCDWLEGGGLEISVALEAIARSEVIFGFADGDLQVQEHARALTTHMDSLEAAPVVDEDPSSRANAMRRVALTELELLKRTLSESFSVYVGLNLKPELRRDMDDDLEIFGQPECLAARLSEIAEQAGLPVTRAVAAEHAGYLYNRAASTAHTADLAVSFHLAAVACSQHAYMTSHIPRHAKYIAQNLLEIATLRNDDFVRECAETIWVDGYAIPYHLGLHGPTLAFEEVGWNAPVFAKPGYEDIPSYSADPSFLYEGQGAEKLRNISASITPDLWAAAVIVVQRFKDLPTEAARAAHDPTLPIYVPGEEGAARFPMLHQHPVAWFFFITDGLLAEHAHDHPHAGLAAASQPNWEQRRRVEGMIEDCRGHLSGEANTGTGRWPRFPALASSLLAPVIEDWRDSGSEGLAHQWSEVVELWS